MVIWHRVRGVEQGALNLQLWTDGRKHPWRGAVAQVHHQWTTNVLAARGTETTNTSTQSRTDFKFQISLKVDSCHP